jgi:hypothetical protein
MTEDDLRRLEEQYLAERGEGESPYRWVQRAYPAWRPMLHFGVSVVIRQQINLVAACAIQVGGVRVPLGQRA